MREFVEETLPLLALHCCREALDELESRSEWLKAFTSKQPDFEDARNRFFIYGSGYMQDLENHIELTRLARANEALTRIFGSVYSLFLAEVQTSFHTPSSTLSYEEGTFLTIEQVEHDKDLSFSPWSHSFLVAGRDAIMSGRKNAGNNERSLIKYKDINASENDCYGTLRKMSEEYNRATAGKPLEYEALEAYYGNIKNFTYKLGCPKAHDNPLRNIVEMRKLHATQMPFFQKLQDDLQDQIRRNNEQQEIITALVFRHLLEHLPPGKTEGGDRNTGPRWQKFWEEASRKELGNMKKQNNADHPMQGLMAKDAIDKGTNKFKDGAKGHLFRTGKILYSTLSDNIHNYKSDGKKGYNVVRSDQWGESVRKILTTLIPTNFNAEGEVEWDKERQRYL
ncbi:MAG: hypothetical protein Q9214_005736 [Letrouitia sp. 1 TL-2023]